MNKYAMGRQKTLAELCESKDVIISELEDKLKLAYCHEVGADSITGLDCCDDYRDWVAALTF